MNQLLQVSSKSPTMFESMNTVTHCTCILNCHL